MSSRFEGYWGGRALAVAAAYAKGAYDRKPTNQVDAALTGTINLVSGLLQGPVGVGFTIASRISIIPDNQREYEVIASRHYSRFCNYTLRGMKQLAPAATCAALLYGAWTVIRPN